MEPDELAGALMFTGGALGLSGTISTFFPFSVMGVISFGLVLAFGFLVSRGRPEGRLLAAATLWFAPLGGIACAIILWFNRSGWFHEDLWDIQGSIGLVGMAVAVAGAIVKRKELRH